MSRRLYGSDGGVGGQGSKKKPTQGSWVRFPHGTFFLFLLFLVFYCEFFKTLLSFHGQGGPQAAGCLFFAPLATYAAIILPPWRAFLKAKIGPGAHSGKFLKALRVQRAATGCSRGLLWLPPPPIARNRTRIRFLDGENEQNAA